MSGCPVAPDGRPVRQRPATALPTREQHWTGERRAYSDAHGSTWVVTSVTGDSLPSKKLSKIFVG